MKLIDQKREQIMLGFYQLWMNLEFNSVDQSLKKAFGPKRFKRIRTAMRKPVMLSETGQRALDVYENHFTTMFLFNRKFGQATC